MSATVGGRPSDWVRVSFAPLIAVRMSCSRRGTRTDQVRSRKYRLSSPTMVGNAYPTKSAPWDGSNRSTALISPTVAVCVRSSSASWRWA